MSPWSLSQWSRAKKGKEKRRRGQANPIAMSASGAVVTATGSGVAIVHPLPLGITGIRASQVDSDPPALVAPPESNASKPLDIRGQIVMMDDCG